MAQQPPESIEVSRKRRARWVWLATALGIACAASAVALGLTATTLGSDVEARTWDWRVRQWTPDRPVSDAVVLEIDEGSLHWLSKQEKIPWPLPRDVWCRVLSELKIAGARLAVFDVLYTEISEFDEPFAACVKDHGATVLAWQCMGEDVSPPPPWRVDNESLRQLPMRSCNSVVPVDMLRDAARFGGRVEMEPDHDGVLRKTTPLLRFEATSEAYPALGLAAAMLATGATPAVDATSLHFGPVQLPIDSGGRALLAWRRPDNPVPRLPLRQLYAASRQREEGLPVTFDAKQVRDKVVFIAGTAAATYEYRVTPVGEGVPGVFAHIALYEMLRGGALARVPPAYVNPMSCGVLALLVAFAALGLSTIVRQTLAAAAALAGYLVFVALAYRSSGVWLGLTAPVVAAFVAFALGSLANYRMVGRERRLIRHAFAHYLEPSVIDQLVQNPDALQLGGERRDITAFFSDIRGFTTLTEATEPAQLVVLLNECLGALTTVLLHDRGTIDKYIGDAIVAMFGAPLAFDDHPLHACRGALGVQRRMAQLRSDFRARGLPELHVRVGMSSGYALVGNMGSVQRFDYTMIGDMVNLAARLEGTAGVYGVDILISHAMAERVKHVFLVREIDAVRVKGKVIGVRIYDLMNELCDATPEQHRAAQALETGLALYRAQQWDAALAILQPLVDQGDGPAKVLVGRVEVLRHKQLAPDWDGVYEFTSK